MAPNPIESARAKVELGVQVQGPFDQRDHALELLGAALRTRED